MAILRPGCGQLRELFFYCVVGLKKCLEIVWIKIIIIQNVKGLFGWFCGQFKSRFWVFFLFFFFFFVGIIYATISLED